MKYSLNQSQQQKMILSPQIRQYLKLLQLPVAELSQCINEEIINNPMLDEKEDQDTALGDQDSSDAIKNEETKAPVQSESSRSDALGDDFWSEIASNSYSPGKSGIADAQKLKDFQEASYSKQESLYDYLLWQIKFLNLTPSQNKIAEEIVGNIDEHGYLKESPEEISVSIKVSVQEVTEILKLIQDLEPAGVGAETLQEALLKQLEKDPSDTTIEQEIIKDNLSLLQKRDWKQLSKSLNVSLERIRQAEKKIARLEPKPGRRFYSEEANSVIPEAVIYYTGDDILKMEFFDQKIPKIRINSYYRSMLRMKNMDAEAKAYLQDKLQKATDFLKALDQRKSTLHLITEQIMKEQTPFFKKGFSHLKPLRLKDIADEVGIHESTVSRAIQNKYIQTPQGTIAYRSFFSTKLETESGEDESQKSIMELLKKTISEEKPTHPLSDQKIVEMLNERGVKIARRTVAKYRDLLKILPSHLRRQK